MSIMSKSAMQLANLIKHGNHLFTIVYWFPVIFTFAELTA